MHRKEGRAIVKRDADSVQVNAGGTWGFSYADLMRLVEWGAVRADGTPGWYVLTKEGREIAEAESV